MICTKKTLSTTITCYSFIIIVKKVCIPALSTSKLEDIEIHFAEKKTSYLGISVKQGNKEILCKDGNTSTGLRE